MWFPDGELLYSIKCILMMEKQVTLLVQGGWPGSKSNQNTDSK